MFHVGSQMTEPSAWREALDEAGTLMEKLAVAGIRLELLDIGGGFPARHADPVPAAAAFGAVIGVALDRPSCDSQDTIMYDVPLSAGLRCGDRVYVGTAGA
jgi:diaminopimelate decarboxylase